MISKVFYSIMLVVFFTTSISAAASSDSITMNLPESVVLSAVKKSLPIDFKLKSSTLRGIISVDQIDNLQFRKNTLSSRVTLSGHQLNIVTSIAGQNLRMKIGNLSMSFQCDATIRFDAASQTLFIRPQVTDLKPPRGQKADIASTIALLFNNREFPVKIGSFEPFVKKTGNKTLNVSMDISTITIKEDTISLHITPDITVTRQKSEAK